MLKLATEVVRMIPDTRGQFKHDPENGVYGDCSSWLLSPRSLKSP